MKICMMFENAHKVCNSGKVSWTDGNYTIIHELQHCEKSVIAYLWQWCSNVLARGPHLSFRNPLQATRINNLINEGKLLLYLNSLK